MSSTLVALFETILQELFYKLGEVKGERVNLGESLYHFSGEVNMTGRIILRDQFWQIQKRARVDLTSTKAFVYFSKGAKVNSS